MPQANDDGPEYLQRSESRTIDVLANDFNPFAPDTPLRIVSAQIDQADVGSSATVSHTDSNLTVRTGAAFTGTLSVIYRIQDGTRDPARETQGRVTVIVRDEPDAPATPTATAGDASATVRWSIPANNNAQIDGYQLDVNGSVRDYPASAGGTNQSVGNLQNGTTYRFRVRAHNEIGWGAWSALSNAVTPYGTPSAPRNIDAQVNGTAPTSVDVSWAAPSDTGGGSVRYEVRLDSGSWTNSGTDRAHRFTGVGAGSHTVHVRAVNLGSDRTGPADSRNFTVQNPPPPQPSARICKGTVSGGGHAVVVRYQNFTSGGHRMYTSLNGDSSAFYKETFNIGGDGSQRLQNWLGIRNDSQIWVAIEGPTNISRTNIISGSQWNNLSPGQCS
jgi:predicted phage tail protein